jgi:hypothetical protein
MRGETAKEVIVLGKAKIDVAAHDAEGMNLYAEATPCVVLRGVSVARRVCLDPT